MCAYAKSYKRMQNAATYYIIIQKHAGINNRFLKMQWRILMPVIVPQPAAKQNQNQPVSTNNFL